MAMIPTPSQGYVLLMSSGISEGDLSTPHTHLMATATPTRNLKSKRNKVLSCLKSLPYPSPTNSSHHSWNISGYATADVKQEEYKVHKILVRRNVLTRQTFIFFFLLFKCYEPLKDETMPLSSLTSYSHLPQLVIHRLLTQTLSRCQLLSLPTKKEKTLGQWLRHLSVIHLLSKPASCDILIIYSTFFVWNVK